MRSKKALINVLTSLFLELIKIICGFIAPILIINTYGSAVNGLISSITKFLAYITLLESGIGPVIKATLYKPLMKKDNKEIANILKAAERFFRTIAIIFIIYIVILCVIYPLIIDNEFDGWFTISLILIISISTFVEYFFGLTYRVFIQADQKKYVVSNIEMFTTVLNTIFIVLLIKIGSSIHIVKLFSSFIFVLRPMLLNMYFKRKYKINLKEASEDYKLKGKWDGLSQHIASVVHDNTDIAVLSIFLNMVEVSVYSVYLLIINGVRRFVESLSSGIDATFGDMIARNENKNINEKFGIYETMYFTLVTIVYICVLLLIVPFVSVYTKNATDADYIRPVFAIIMVLAEFVFAIRLPYNSLTLAGGYIKETRVGGWVEAIVNVVLSVALVQYFGIVGVAIGTLVAMIIRTIEFMIFSSKVILKRSILTIVKKMICIIIEVIIMVIINEFLANSLNDIASYLDWIKYAIIFFIITALEVLLINYIFYRKDFKKVKDILRNFKKKKIYNSEENG